MEHVLLFENRHAIAEVSDCERTPGGGSLLVWPKQHVERISQLSDDQAQDVVRMLYRASASLVGAFGPQGLHTFCSAGTLVGQSEAHMHFQIQPRYRDRPYSFASARDLPTIPLATRMSMVQVLLRHDVDAAPCDTLRESIVFRDADMPAPSPQSGMDPDLVVDETSHFVALCHPQARSVGAVVVMAKRQVSCFLELKPQERSELMLLVRDLAGAIERALSPDGLSVWWDTGMEANQAGSDFLVEMVPRFADIPYRHEHRQLIATGRKDAHLDAVNAYRRMLRRGMTAVAAGDGVLAS